MEERRKKGREREGGGKLVGMMKNETRQRSKKRHMYMYITEHSL